MATTQSAELVKVDAVNTFLEPNEAGHTVRTFNFVTLDNDDTTTVEVARLEKGERFKMAAIQHGALGTSVTLALGTTADADRFLTATAAASAGQIVAYGSAASAVTAFEPMTAKTSVYLTVGGANADDSIEVQGWIEVIKA